MMEAVLTGRTRFRLGFFHKMVLQVEEKVRDKDPWLYTNTGPSYTYWRDATIEDVQYLEKQLGEGHIFP